MYLYYALDYNEEMIGIVKLLPSQESRHYAFSLIDADGKRLPRNRGPMLLSKCEFETYLAFGVPLLKEIKRNYLKHAKLIFIELQIPHE